MLRKLLNRYTMIEYTGTKDNVSISISFSDNGCVIGFMEQECNIMMPG